MAKKTIIGDALPNVPWEEKPKDCNDVVWRSEKNPVITRDILVGEDPFHPSQPSGPLGVDVPDAGVRAVTA